MRNIGSAFYAALQEDAVLITELIELDSRTHSWRWTTSNQEVVSSLQTYTPFPGESVSGVEESIDLGISATDFIISNSGGIFDELFDSDGLDFATVVIRRVLVNSADLDSMEIFRGNLADYSYNRSMLTGQARNRFHGVDIKWPYYTYMDQCTWRFGGTGCAFDTSSVTITGSVNASSDFINVTLASSTIVGSAYGDDFFSRGRFTLTSGQSSGEVRTIRVQTGDLLQLSHRLPFNVTSDDSFSLFPGCRKRLVADCISKYNNSSNFLGFPWIPRQEDAF